jgi:hypothetical protein
MISGPGAMMIDYQEPQPTGQSKARVFGAAEAFARANGFSPGDRIEPLVNRLGGVIEYLGSLESIEATDGSLFVNGERDFIIKVSAFTGAERDRFTIAHELGHYVLHSSQGKKPIRAARFGTNRVEWEANWFAAAFLMPAEDFRATCKRHHNDCNLVAARYLVSPRAAEVRMRTLGTSGA